MNTFLRILMLSLLFISSSISAGEIYQCRAENGGMEFSDKPCLEQAFSGPSDAHKLWREVSQLSKIGESMVDQRGASPELRRQCRAKMEAMSTKIDGMKSRIDKLEPQYNMIVTAYEELPKCLSCGQNATYYCRQSSQILKTAANELHYRR